MTSTPARSHTNKIKPDMKLPAANHKTHRATACQLWFVVASETDHTLLLEPPGVDRVA